MMNVFFETSFCSLIELPLRRSVHLSVLYSAIQGAYPLPGGQQVLLIRNSRKGVGKKTS